METILTLLITGVLLYYGFRILRAISRAIFSADRTQNLKISSTQHLSHEIRTSCLDQIRNACLKENSDLGKLKEDINLKVASDLEKNPPQALNAQIGYESIVFKLLSDGWEAAIEEAFEDNLLSQEEERALTRFRDHFSLDDDFVSKKGERIRQSAILSRKSKKIEQGAILREVFEGRVPAKTPSDLRFNFTKKETLVYQCKGVDYYEWVTQSRIKGSSHGLSIRVAKGLYYRPSTFSAGVEKTENNEYLATGDLAITDQHIYFVSSMISFRIPYKKIVSFEPYSDGLGVQKDGVRAKPQTFMTDDGWFLYNLVTNLPRA